MYSLCIGCIKFLIQYASMMGCFKLLKTIICLLNLVELKAVMNNYYDQSCTKSES